MPLRRRPVLLSLAAAAALPWPMAAAAQGRPRDQAVLGMVLEPPGLDPTTAAAAAIGEVVHLNVLEGLTRITMDGAVMPLLAEAWDHTPDGKAYSFLLREGVRFADGRPLTAEVVKWSFDRARAEGSTNKLKKAFWDNVASVRAHDARTVVITLDHADALTPFRLGEAPSVILHPDSAAQAASRPVGTGPYLVDAWAKGSSITLVRNPGHRDPARAALRRVVFRFIGDPSAQVAALLAGDIDAMPRFGALQSMKAFQADRRFTVTVGTTAGKGLLAINNRRKPFDDLRVRRAINHAIDRKAFIDGAQEGLGRPIGSHFAPTDIAYVDLSGRYPHDPERARALLREAGVRTPLNVTLTLPPPAYARQGGQIIAAQLAQVGIVAKIENVEWAQWLAGPFKGQFDLTLINHVEPLDYATAYADPGYYFGYDSPAFRRLVDELGATQGLRDKSRLWRAIQTQLADDAVNAWIWNPAQVSVARRGLEGLWTSSPIAANDLAALRWAAR